MIVSGYDVLFLIIGKYQVNMLRLQVLNKENFL